jgi:flavin-dependent dehydrogenase
VLCLAVRNGKVRPWAELLNALIAGLPQLRMRLGSAEPLLPRPLAVGGVPYGFLRQTTTTGSSDATIYRLGDQAAVIPSLAGDGIAIALHSGSLAASCWVSGMDATAYHGLLAADLTRQIRIAGALHALALHPILQRGLPFCCGLFPPIMQLAAAATRLRASAKFTEQLPTRGLHPA